MDEKKGDKEKNLKTVIIDTVSNIIHTKLDDFVENIKTRINHTKKVLIEKLFSLILLLIGMIFLLISFTYFLIEYLNLSKSVSFFIVAVIIFVFAFIVKYHSDKN